MKRGVIVYEARTKEDLWKRAARELASFIRDTVDERGTCILALCGGRSAPGVFTYLRSEEGVPWRTVHIFLVDERLVPLHHKESNARLLNEHLTGPLVNEGVLDDAQVHVFRQESGVEGYARSLQARGGRFDVVLLSAGEDGHVAGLYPNHHSVEDEADFFITMHDSPKPPRARMSASRKLLERSGRAVVLFSGVEKRRAFKRFQEEQVPVKECPAKVVMKAGACSVFVTDAG